eukprot:jgi/Chrzof1/3839/Cz13g10200.t1
MSTWLILAIGLQVFPKGQRPPLLLQTLESELLERINAACRSASTGPQQARDPLIAANLMLDANRQVFHTFVENFGAYTPLLRQIKAELDRAIDEGVKCACHNTVLRQQLLDSKRAERQAVKKARAHIIDGDLPVREDLHKRIAAAQYDLSKIKHKADLAQRDLSMAKQELERIRGLSKSSKATKQRLQDAVTSEHDWCSRPGMAAILQMTVGPLTQQEDEELESEMGLPPESPNEPHPLEKALKLLEERDAAAAAKILQQHTGTHTPVPSRAVTRADVLGEAL